MESDASFFPTTRLTVHSQYCECRDVHLWNEALRKLNWLLLHKNKLVETQNLMETVDQSPSCQHRDFVSMPPLTPTRAQAVSWEGWHLSTLINGLQEFQIVAQGKIYKVRAAKSSSKAAHSPKTQFSQWPFW